jgi:hypothetical protein
MILYNYKNSDYSVVKILDSLDKSLNYIRCQENEYYDKFKMIQLTNQKQLVNEIDNDYLNICCVSNNKYNNLDLSKYDNVSSYIIVPMLVS